ncbi:MAG TPA: hypothetical protein VG938_03940 [Verrucomicrobiae bacterium]|nr:hypothetical protein [Verrucomicrobiae bacterium]
MPHAAKLLVPNEVTPRNDSTNDGCGRAAPFQLKEEASAHAISGACATAAKCPLLKANPDPSAVFCEKTGPLLVQFTPSEEVKTILLLPVARNRPFPEVTALSFKLGFGLATGLSTQKFDGNGDPLVMKFNAKAIEFDPTDTNVEFVLLYATPYNVGTGETPRREVTSMNWSGPTALHVKAAPTISEIRAIRLRFIVGSCWN